MTKQNIITDDVIIFSKEYDIFKEIASTMQHLDLGMMYTRVPSTWYPFSFKTCG